MRIGFLLGAGVSIPAGMASTSTLTEAVLQAENYRLHTDGTFVAAGTGGLVSFVRQEVNQQVLKSLLQTVRDDCEVYFKTEHNKRSVNYEDLFFACNQLQEHLSFEYENPAIEPFAQSVLRRLPGIQSRTEFNRIVKTACGYIRDVVSKELSEKPKGRLDHLKCLVDAASDQQLKGCDVFTLNHDTLIEQVLQNEAISFIDGFGEPDGDVALWNSAVLDAPSSHFFLKLHGSIDWAPLFDGRLAKILVPDRDHACTKDGVMLDIPGPAKVLVGTFNKIRDYFEMPYFELFAAFRRQTEQIHCLIVSGYSFGDKGVNTVLNEWMRGGNQRVLLVLDAKGDHSIDDARGAIQGLWERYKGKQMHIRRNYLNECDWRDLRGEYRIY